ncbi:MAG: hypothetical protein JRG88_11425 [Deltaproteobacteria bacterium]|nr:hypothetical protein [Deltaproteobacteria bacterium]
MPCVEACPRNVFASKRGSTAHSGQDRLPGRNAAFIRDRCNGQMRADLRGAGASGGSVLYCRRCEFTCPAG